MLILLWIITTARALSPITYRPVTIINQTNVYELFYDLANRIECHNFTDIYGYPLVYAADDFVLPSYRDLDLVNGLASDCNALSFSFTVVRSRQDQDPQNITLRLFYHDPNTGGPLEPPFYQRTFCAPINTVTCSTPGCCWDPRIRVALPIVLTLQNGDISDDGVTTFDLSNMNLLPVGRTLWAAMYITVPGHYANNLLKENSLFWMTLNNKSGSTPIQPLLANNRPNYNYRYKDVNNLRRYNLTNWTDGQVAQQFIGVRNATSTYNMAWRITLMCNTIGDIATLPPFPPTRQVTPTEAPTRTPSASPTGSIAHIAPIEVYTEAPTAVENTTNTSWTGAPTRIWIDTLKTDRLTQILVGSIIGSLALVCALVCACVVYLRKNYGIRLPHRKSGKTSIKEFLQRSEKKDIELTTLSGYSEAAPSETPQQSLLQQSPRLSAAPRKNASASQTWLSDEAYTEISLNNEEEKDEFLLRAWLNSSVPTAVTTTNTTTTSEKKKLL